MQQRGRCSTPCHAHVGLPVVTPIIPTLQHHQLAVFPPLASAIGSPPMHSRLHARLPKTAVLGPVAAYDLWGCTNDHRAHHPGKSI